MRKEDLLLYAITDRTWQGSSKLSEQIEAVLKGGATLLQLREKELSYEQFITEAKEVRKITLRYQIPLIINDRIDVAAAVDADGVHLGQDDDTLMTAREILGSDKIIGISAHTVEEAISAQRYGADYIGAGAVFGTATKKDANPLKLDILSQICDAVTIPVVAIGGITRDNIMSLAGSGVDGVAVISSLFAAEDITTATSEMLALAKKMIRRLL